jgi:hypothetical protein
LTFQDLVVAWLVYQGALKRGVGHCVDFSGESSRNIPNS